MPKSIWVLLVDLRVSNPIPSATEFFTPEVANREERPPINGVFWTPYKSSEELVGWARDVVVVVAKKAAIEVAIIQTPRDPDASANDPQRRENLFSPSELGLGSYIGAGDVNADKISLSMEGCLSRLPIERGVKLLMNLENRFLTSSALGYPWTLTGAHIAKNRRAVFRHL